jgi:hypothetical protein
VDKEKIKHIPYISVSVITIVMTIIVFIMLLPHMWHDCCLRFKELNGTISAREKNELEKQRKSAAEVWW